MPEMLRHLSLRHFQSWPTLELPLSAVTVIVGETNTGKSSILRALSAVLYNALDGAAMVRAGQTQADVVLATDSHVVRWSRSEKVNRFELDGVVFDKVGRTVPGAVSSALEITPLEFDGETVRLQWAPQMSSPFLIGDSGAKATRMLGSAGNVAVVAQAAKLAGGEVKQQSDLAAATALQLQAVERELVQLQWVTEAAPVAEALSRAMEEGRQLRARADTVQAALTQLRTAAGRQERLARCREAATQHRHVTQQVSALLDQREALLRVAQGRALAERVRQQLVLAQAMREAAQRQAHAWMAGDQVTKYFHAKDRYQRVIEQQQQAMQQRDGARLAYERLLAEVTCAACGQIKEAA